MTQTITTSSSLSSTDSTILESTMGCTMYGAFTPKMPEVSILVVSPSNTASIINSNKVKSSQITYLITFYYVGYGNASFYQSKLVDQVSTAIASGLYNDILESYVIASGTISPLTSATVSSKIEFTPPQITSVPPSTQPASSQSSSSSSNSSNSAGAAAGIAIGVIFAVLISVAAFYYYRNYLSASKEIEYDENGEIIGNNSNNNNAMNKGSITSKIDFDYPNSAQNGNGNGNGNYYDNNQYVEKAATYAPNNNIVQMSTTTANTNDGMKTELQDGDVTFNTNNNNNQLTSDSINQENPMKPPSLGAFLDGDDGGVKEEVDVATIIESPKAGIFRTSLAAFFD